MIDRPVWLFELYNTAKEVVYSLLIDEVTGENTILKKDDGWRDQFMIESFFVYDSEADATSWSGKNMNSYWFVSDLISNISFAERSLESFSWALRDLEDLSSSETGFEGLEELNLKFSELQEWYTNLELPFQPSAADVDEVEQYLQAEVTRQRGDYQWSPEFWIPKPDSYYIDHALAVVTDVLGAIEQGELREEVEVQQALDEVSENWNPLEDSDYYLQDHRGRPVQDLSREMEELVRCLMLDQEWWGAEARIRKLVESVEWEDTQAISSLIEHEQYWEDGRFRPPLHKFSEGLDEPEPLPMTRKMILATNHPDVLRVNIADYYQQHRRIATQKVECYKEVLALYPEILKKFDDSSFVNRHWIYRAFDREGQLLYIGETINPLVRLREHAGLGSINHAHHRLVSPWFSTMATFHLESCFTQAEAKEKEALYIKLEQPRYNKTHNSARLAVSEEGVPVNEVPSRNDPRNVGWKGHRHVPPMLPIVARVVDESTTREGYAFYEDNR